MSIDNSELLLLLGGEKEEDPIVTKQTIGVAGKRGFGVGIYGGDLSQVKGHYLNPMTGYNDSSSENYGNYQEGGYGSIMVFIPAFCYRIGNPNAPSYARDGVNALEIRDALEMGMPVESDQVYWVPPDGFILHRAFIDGGYLRRGFFIDKYLCSRHPTLNVARSVKGANPLSIDRYNGDITMGIGSTLTGTGRMGDAIDLTNDRGSVYGCMTAFQWSALAMLSMAHGQAATSDKSCAWYDPNHVTNYPKGCNNGSLGDVDDSSVKYTANSKMSNAGQTGSGTPFAKTTHNGQACGVADLNGVMYQVVTGVFMGDSPNTLLVALEDNSARDFPLSADDFLTEETSGSYIDEEGLWAETTTSCFPSNTYGVDKALCGVLPVAGTINSSGSHLFGKDSVTPFAGANYIMLVGGNSSYGSDGGIWARNCLRALSFSSDANVGFRAGAYLK